MTFKADIKLNKSYQKYDVEYYKSEGVWRNSYT